MTNKKIGFGKIADMTNVELLAEKSWMEQLGKEGEMRLWRLNKEIQKRFAEKNNK